MAKVNTVEQYKILEFIKNNFNADKLEIELVYNHIVRVKDTTGEYMTFKSVDDEITYIYN
ncbi:MAG: hypothetical protein ACRC68_10135 [Clostridium sp.]